MQTSFIECMLYLLSPNKFMQRIGEDEEEVDDEEEGGGVGSHGSVSMYDVKEEAESS